MQSITIFGLLLNIMIICFFSHHLTTRIPFKTPFKNWNAQDKYKFFAFSAAIIQQAVNFYVKLTNPSTDLTHILGVFFFWCVMAVSISATLYRFRTYSLRASIELPDTLLYTAAQITSVGGCFVAFLLYLIHARIYRTRELWYAHAIVNIIVMVIIGIIDFYLNFVMVRGILQACIGRKDLQSFKKQLVGLLLVQIVIVAFAAVFYVGGWLWHLDLGYIHDSLLFIPVYGSFMVLGMVRDFTRMGNDQQLIQPIATGNVEEDI